MSTSLYELSALYRQTFEQLEETDLPEAVKRDTLEGVEAPLKDKLQAIAAYIREEENKISGIKQAIQGMTQRCHSAQKNVQWLKQYALDVMTLNDFKKIECPWFVVSVAKNPPSVEIEDERQIPKDYFTDPPPPLPKLDKELIRQALKDGHHVPGCRLKQGVRLQIR